MRNARTYLAYLAFLALLPSFSLRALEYALPAPAIGAPAPTLNSQPGSERSEKLDTLNSPTAPTLATAPAADPAKPLSELVGKLSARDTLIATDLADFANKTIDYSQALQDAKQPVSEKPIRDALAAVDMLRKLNPKAAGLDDLQSRLEKFLEKPPEEQKQDQQQDKNDQKQNQQDKQNQKQNQSGGSDNQQQQQQNQQDQSQQNQQSQQQRQNQQNADQSQQNQSQQQQSRQQQDQQQNAQSPSQNQQQPQNQQNAFSDMQKTEEQKNAEKQNQNSQSQEQQRQTVQAADMQQVGGDTGDKPKKPVDARMVIPLQKLDEVRDADTPAIIFQRMQARQSGTTQPLPEFQKPKGKDW